jgi:glycosyltransferase involved in cell wall biosynthesis
MSTLTSALSTTQVTSDGAPLASCIMIFLNAERFIQEAIQSIFAQTEPSWELLLVDDGSTDGSTSLARHYAEQRPGKVRYLEHEGHQNLGMSASRNLGISNARGANIAFLDSDDVWLPNKLRAQLTMLDDYPEAGMVYGPTQYWYSWTNRREDRERDFMGIIGVEPDTLVEPPDLLKQTLRDGGATLPGICSILARREAVAAVNGFETSFRGPYEDQAFLVKMFLKHSILVSDSCLDLYRQHPNSCCSQAIARGDYHPMRPHPARRTFLTWLAEYLSAEGVKDPEIWNALHRALRPYRLAYRLVGPVERGARRLKHKATPHIKRTWLWPLYRKYLAMREGEPYSPPIDWVRFGDLRRTNPISREYGYDRGLPIDRYYIEGFLSRHAEDIHGQVIEIGDAAYTRQFGGSRVTTSDVLHVDEANPAATIIGDLTCADHVPSSTFDCFILTQTLQLIYDIPAALRTVYRILKPGGVVLATVPGISQISNDQWGAVWYWSFTSLSAKRLFEEVFPKGSVEVEAHGNVLAATAFLQGVATRELSQEELDRADREYQMLVTIRAMKPAAAAYEDMTGRWQYQPSDGYSYGDDATYRKGMEFLDRPGDVIEDWGCGTGYAKKFVTLGTYRGIDGSPGGSTDHVVDLRRYTSEADCIFMRHVLEHNPFWREILKNALSSFRKRMVLIVFTPFMDETRHLEDSWSGIPTIAFRKQEVTELFEGLSYTEEPLQTDTEYGVEHIFYFEKDVAGPAPLTPSPAV